MKTSLRATLLAGSMLAAWPVLAADVTPDRLVNADKEPGNWLMNHRTYDSQRYSPLDKINKANVKNLKLAYAVAIGGTAVNENLQSTPLAEDGFLYLPTNGVCSTRSTGVQVIWAASSGAWTPARRRCRWQTAAPRCGATSSSPSRTTRRG
jgi:glucose dehydrogenase